MDLINLSILNFQVAEIEAEIQKQREALKEDAKLRREKVFFLSSLSHHFFPSVHRFIVLVSYKIFTDGFGA